MPAEGRRFTIKDTIFRSLGKADVPPPYLRFAGCGLHLLHLDKAKTCHQRSSGDRHRTTREPVNRRVKLSDWPEELPSFYPGEHRRRSWLRSSSGKKSPAVPRGL